MCNVLATVLFIDLSVMQVRLTYKQPNEDHQLSFVLAHYNPIKIHYHYQPPLLNASTHNLTHRCISTMMAIYDVGYLYLQALSVLQFYR